MKVSYSKRIINIFIVMLIIFISCKNNKGYETRSQGESSFRTYCQTCHVLPKPSKKTDEEWLSLVKRYGIRARLSEKEVERITAYLISVN